MCVGIGEFDGFSIPEELKAKYLREKSIFLVGEELKIRGSLFRVHEVTPFGIKLKLLKPKNG